VSWLRARPPTWKQPVGWGTWHETPPVTTAPMVRERPGDWLFLAVVRPAWAYRVELGLISLLGVAYYRLEALFVLALVTGLREGELLGLRWWDVDLDAGTVTVRGAM
jgi:integrase